MGTDRARGRPVFTYDVQARTTRLLRPAFTAPVTTHVLYRPFAEVGFKAYLNRKVFFRADMRTVFHSGLDEVLFRFGVGVDVGAASSPGRN